MTQSYLKTIQAQEAQLLKQLENLKREKHLAATAEMKSLLLEMSECFSADEHHLIQGLLDMKVKLMSGKKQAVKEEHSHQLLFSVVPEPVTPVPTVIKKKPSKVEEVMSICEDGFKQGKKLSEIAEELGITIVELRKMLAADPSCSRKQFIFQHRKSVYEKGIKEGKSLSTIAKELNLGVSSLHIWIHRNGIVQRKKYSKQVSPGLLTPQPPSLVQLIRDGLTVHEIVTKLGIDKKQYRNLVQSINVPLERIADEQLFRDRVEELGEKMNKAEIAEALDVPAFLIINTCRIGGIKTL